jgi:hypothetical protein
MAEEVARAASRGERAILVERLVQRVLMLAGVSQSTAEMAVIMGLPFESGAFVGGLWLRLRGVGVEALSLEHARRTMLSGIAISGNGIHLCPGLPLWSFCEAWGSPSVVQTLAEGLRALVPPFLSMSGEGVALTELEQLTRTHFDVIIGPSAMGRKAAATFFECLGVGLLGCEYAGPTGLMNAAMRSWMGHLAKLGVSVPLPMLKGLRAALRNHRAAWGRRLEALRCCLADAPLSPVSQLCALLNACSGDADECRTICSWFDAEAPMRGGERSAALLNAPFRWSTMDRFHERPGDERMPMSWRSVDWGMHWPDA